MRPEWFSIQEELLPHTNPLTTVDHGDNARELPPIPLEKMWADDEFWMPAMFGHRHFVGRADFGVDNKMIKWWFGAAAPAGGGRSV